MKEFDRKVDLLLFSCMQQTGEQQEPAAFHVENWYPVLKRWTFDTVILPLHANEAECLSHYREARRHALTKARYQLTDDPSSKPSAARKLQQEDFINADANALASLPAHERPLLDDLRVRLSTPINEYVARTGGAFVKLSSRSPKDAALTSTSLKVLLHSLIRASNLHAETYEALEEDLLFFVQAHVKALRVTSADEALHLLLSSTRTFQDILLCNLRRGDADFRMNLIVREWKDFSPELEIRAFVFNNRLTAATQYYSICPVPLLVQRHKEIEQLLLSFWNENLSSLPYLVDIGTYTIDFVLSPDLSTVTVIEINPPPPLAGSSLFDWNIAADKALMMNGPFSLRVKSFPPFPPPYSDVVHSHLTPVFAADYIHVTRGRQGVVEASSVKCESCTLSSSSNVWFHCQECLDADLCESCFLQSNDHTSRHKFVSIKGKTATPHVSENTPKENEERCRMM